MRRVDVIVPCYKYGHFLETCVRSILDQEGVEVRILVIDDCSPDGSADVGELLARTDGRVEFRRHSANVGHIRTYNEGIDWASAPYLLLISADDALATGSLARSVAVLERSNGMELVFGRAVRFYENSDPPQVTCPTEFGYDILDGSKFIDEMCDLPRNPVSTPTVVVRTEVQKRLGGYDERLPHTGDLEMWLRFANVGTLGYIDAAQAFRRVHRSNMMLQYRAAHLGDQLQLQAAFEIFAERQLQGDMRRQLLSRARGGLALDALWHAERAFDDGDLPRTKALAEFAVTLMPTLTENRRWSRLVWKRRLGFQAFRILDRLRSAVAPRRQTVVPAEARPASLRMSM